MKSNKTLLVLFVALLCSSPTGICRALVVTTAEQLATAVRAANDGGDTTIQVADGTYTLDDMLWVSAAGVSVAGLSGNRDAVIIEGHGMDGDVTHIFNVQGSHFSARHLTLRRVSQHAVQFQPEAEAPILDDLHILDTGEQMVKVSYYPDHLSISVDNGVLENSTLEYSAGIGPQWYIGGIDAHNAGGWVVRNNIFRSIRSPSDSLAEHAVHFWSGSRDTLVERNLIINCDRGIGFGLGDRGHSGGIIRNNMIYHDATEGFADVGIGLESAPGARVYNNTIYQEHGYPNAIEYRFSATRDVVIANNLTNRLIVSRDGGSASLSHNLTGADAAWFQDVSRGDLHLSGPCAAVDRGETLAGLNDDFDGDPRPEGIGIDIGADETRATTIFNSYPHSDGDRRPAKTYEEDRTISGHQGEATVLSFRLSLYGTASRRMPLLVQVHEWGGDFDREEAIASYVPAQYNFVMLYFQYKPASGNQDDWWFGTRWDGECHLWAHQAIMAIVREAIETSLVTDHLPGVTIDGNRVYLFGHSIGGTGAWQLGVRHPEVFAAIHAHSGFARFTPPVGLLQQQFERDIVGTEEDHVIIFDDDGTSYPARSFSNLSWWLNQVHGARRPIPFVNMTAGTADEIVPAASGGDLMNTVFDLQKRGFFYHRHWSGHSEDCFVQLNWMWNFRLDQSFLAFTHRRGYGIRPDETVSPDTEGGVNDLHQMGWDPASIVDQPDHYEVRLTGSGTADVTLRRLQHFRVIPDGCYRYRVNAGGTDATTVIADHHGLLTVADVNGGDSLIIEPCPTPAHKLLTGTIDDLDHQWAPLTWSENYTNPVVIMGPPSFHGSDPGIVRLRNLNGAGLERRFQEWLCLDGWHTRESASYLVMEAGRYTMADDSTWEAGSFALDGTGKWRTVAFTERFPEPPLLLLTVQGFNGSDPVTVRAREVTAAGFSAALFEEEAKMDGHLPERVGYLAIYSPGRSGSVFAGGAQVPYLVETVSIDERFAPVLSCSLKMEEERSRDSETDHVDERIAVLALGRGLFAQDVSTSGTDTAAIRKKGPEPTTSLEWGRLEQLNQEWITVPLARAFDQPVVTALPVSAHGSDPGVVRVRNVTPTSFQVRFQEWLYLDGHHIDEQLFYLVAEKGDDRVADLAVKAGTLSSSRMVKDGLQQVSFDSPFAAAPAVFAQCLTNSGSDPVIVRIDGVRPDGFEIALDEEEAKRDGHVVEALGWIALEKGTAELAGNRTLKVFTTTANDRSPTTDFGITTYGRFPVLIGGITTTNDADPCLLRYRKLKPTSAQLFVQEETSADTETTHSDENISLMVVSP